MKLNKKMIIPVSLGIILLGITFYYLTSMKKEGLENIEPVKDEDKNYNNACDFEYENVCNQDKVEIPVQMDELKTDIESKRISIKKTNEEKLKKWGQTLTNKGGWLNESMYCKGGKYDNGCIFPY